MSLKNNDAAIVDIFKLLLPQQHSRFSLMQCTYTSYLRGGLAPSAEATWSGPMRNPDMTSGPKSLRGFNKLHKRKPT